VHRLRDSRRDALQGVSGAREDAAGAHRALMGQTPDERASHDDPPLYRARIAAALAPMHSEPLVASQQVSQQLAGHDVDVMDEEGDWVRGRGEDDYEGWIHKGFLEPEGVTLDTSNHRRVSLGCTVERTDGARRTLPLRAILRGDENVIAGEAVEMSQAAARFPLVGERIAASARDLFRGTSYIWGGVTPWGADCSGLVQSSFALHGRVLPRDAWQQAELGTPVTGEFGTLLTGDLLFFTDRPDKRVTHVGMSLGSGRMVHLALGRGGYAVESLQSDEPYVAKLRQRYLFARRLV
jgi:cell wall-associated NlpC family hydrolase